MKRSNNKTLKNIVISGGLIGAGVLYTTFTFDVIPDTIPVIGWIDDGVLGFLIGRSVLSMWREGKSVWATLQNVSRIRK